MCEMKLSEKNVTECKLRGIKKKNLITILVDIWIGYSLYLLVSQCLLLYLYLHVALSGLYYE
jgi:hypothetical protein